jgi:exo-1,4-beta-D-glucosaminidase
MFKRLGMLCRLGWLGGMVAAAALSAPAQELLPLKEGWQLRSSAETPDKGEALSQPGYGVEGWHRVSVPTTLLAALAENGVYPDPFYGDNLTKIPGYKPDRWLAMSPDSPFYPSWWYRTEFTVPESMRGKHVVLHVDGINYKANVWLNGTRVADDSKVVGMFRRFEFPVTEALKYGEPNALAIEVTGPGHIEDKPYRTKQLEATTGWDDHNPQPPDLNTGIWQEVYLTATGSVDLMHPYVATDLDLPSLDTARLTVSVDAVNRTDREQAVQLEGEIKGATFSDGQPVAIALQDTLKPGETKTLRFEPVTLDKPRVWWPHPVGPQDLYDLRLSARAGDEASDTEYVRFGVREATTYINDEGWRGYRVNGRDILIRGGAWMTADMLLRLHPRQYDGLVRHAREANLNMLRSEGFSIRETDDMYSLCDAYGVMVTQQIFGRSIPDEQLAIDNIRDTLLRIRNHPSLVHFLGHDETFPTETLDKAYRDMIAELTPDRTYQPHSGAFDVDERHETGGTRTGTRELWTYAGPAHYYTHKNDGAWGFAQSGGIGGVFAPLDSMKRMMPESALWPPTNETWSLHTVIQGGEVLRRGVRGDDAALRRGEEHRGTGPQGRSNELRERAGHVRGLRAEQVFRHGDHAVEMRCGVAGGPDLALRGLVPPAHGRLLWREEGLRGPARAVFLRRPFGVGREQPVRALREPQGNGARV